MLAAIVIAPIGSQATPSAPTADTIAVIGDYGSGAAAERNVSMLVGAARPVTVVTTGDNVYTEAGYSVLVGRYYQPWISARQFLPATGNHDYAEGISAFDAYFTQLHSQRYYSATRGDVTFFVLDSQAALDSAGSMARQRLWLKAALAASSARFKVVVLHHPPYSSSSAHGSTRAFRWPFARWGADLVLAGHDHTYERLNVGGLTYIVDGAGGQALYGFAEPLPQSRVRYSADFGAVFLTPTDSGLQGSFRTVHGRVVDRFSLPG
jgi:3',5'-cyclic AMP phosphodiesterase CpdA